MQFVEVLPYIAERCAPLFSDMDIYRLGDDDDWRYSMLPKLKSDKEKCNVFVFLGFSKGLAVELQIKRDLLVECDMFAMHYDDTDTAHDFVLNVGEFVQGHVRTWNGAERRSLATIIAQTMELKPANGAIVAEHVFITEIDDVYSILPYVLKTDGYIRYIVSCQLTLDLPPPTPHQLRDFIEFIRGVINEERYTILAVTALKPGLRVYLFNHHHRSCKSRYGVD